jgi:hypothetical protein
MTINLSLFFFSHWGASAHGLVNLTHNEHSNSGEHEISPVTKETSSTVFEIETGRKIFRENENCLTENYIYIFLNQFFLILYGHAVSLGEFGTKFNMVGRNM